MKRQVTEEQVDRINNTLDRCWTELVQLGDNDDCMEVLVRLLASMLYSFMDPAAFDACLDQVKATTLKAIAKQQAEGARNVH